MDLDDATANIRLQAIADAIDADSAPGTLSFYNGTKPVVPGAAITTETLLAVVSFGQPAGEVAARTLTLDLPASIQLIASGTIGWARARDGAGVWRADLTIGAGDPQAAPIPSDPDIVLDTLTAQAGGFIVILSSTVVE